MGLKVAILHGIVARNCSCAFCERCFGQGSVLTGFSTSKANRALGVRIGEKYAAPVWTKTKKKTNKNKKKKNTECDFGVDWLEH